MEKLSKELGLMLAELIILGSVMSPLTSTESAGTRAFENLAFPENLTGARLNEVKSH